MKQRTPKKKKKKKTRVAKTKTTRKRSRVVVRKRIVKRTRTPKRTPPKRKRRRIPASVEYSVNVSYRNSKRPQNAISFQMSVFGPPNQTKDQVIDVVTETIISEGEYVKKGWTVKIVSWKGGQVPKSVPWGSLAIIAGEPTTRFSV